MIELVAPDVLPVMPDWLTPEGQAEWEDLLPRVSALASEGDSGLLGSLANLQGALAAAWRSGEVPPIGAISEHRRLCELFGIAGARSRLVVRPRGDAPNPFARNGRRPDG